MDVEFSDAFGARYPRLRFGIASTRESIGGPDPPLVGSLNEPSVGLPLDRLKVVVRHIGGAGVDFMKDDELMADSPFYR